MILNMPGGKMRKVEQEDSSEETLPDPSQSALSQSRDGIEEPQVPKLLIKFAGPNNTSPTVNKVQGRM